MRRLVTITLPCLFLMLVGCGTTPNPRFYALTSAPAPPSSASSTMTVSVGPVTIPAAVDRPQIVLTVGPNRVRLEEFDRWAAPLQNDIARAVAANLVAALGTSRVMLASAPVTAIVDYRAIIEIQQFESTLGQAALLDAVWAVVRTKDGKSQTGRTTARESTSDGGFDALAAAHSRALGRLSQDLANAMRELARSGS
jgi:uncharacterized lipoprotein YmbA